MRWPMLLFVFATAARGCLAGQLVCTVSVPAIPEGSEAVTLRVFGEQEQPRTVGWRVTGGTVQGAGPEVQWGIKGLRPGPYVASARVPATEPFQSCSVRLNVTERLRGSASGGALLATGKTERVGYGAYTYLLFGSGPTEDTRSRFLAAIQAYKRLSPNLSSLDNYFPLKQLNANYIPVNSAPITDVSDEWILNHYDYARARFLLSFVAGSDKRNGPYLITFRSPPSRDSPSQPILFQDLSWVPPNLVDAWYRQFLNEAAQVDLSKSNAVQDLVLHMRTIIGVLSLGVPDVRDALSKLIR